MTEGSHVSARFYRGGGKKQSEAAQQFDLLAASPSPAQLPRDPGYGEPPAGLLPHLHLVRPRSTPLLSVCAGWRSPRPPRLGFQSRADLSATSRSDSALAG